MYNTPTSGATRDLMLTRQSFWAGLTVAGSFLAILGMLVLPWYNRAAAFRSGGGLTFFQWHQQTHSMIPYWVALIAYIAIAVVVFTRATHWSAWAGVALACITFADASWKMSAMLLVPTPLDLSVGVGYYSLMAGAAFVLIGSIQRVVQASQNE